MYVNHTLFYCLSSLFNAILLAGYVTSSFCTALIIPLVKDKAADLTDVNNNHVITQSSVLSDVFEMRLVELLQISSVLESYSLSVKSSVNVKMQCMCCDLLLSISLF